MDFIDPGTQLVCHQTLQAELLESPFKGRTHDLDTPMPYQTDLLEDLLDNHIILNKPTRAIHVKVDWRLNQRRAANVLFWWAALQPPHITMFEMPIRMFRKLMGFASNNYRYIRETIEDMERASIRWGLLEKVPRGVDAETGYLHFFPFMSCRKGFISYSIEENLRRELLDPDVYTRLNLFEQTRITTSHTLTLWENCSRYRGTGRTPWITVDVFRELMGVVEYPLYQDFRYLNARLIKPAIKQINDVTSIQVELKTKRLSRRITEVQFLVTPNANYDGPIIGQGQLQRRKVRLTDKRERLLLDLRAYGIQDGKARDLLALYSERHIQDNFNYARDQVDRGGIGNKAGLAVWAIERDAANVAASEERERLFEQTHKKTSAAKRQCEDDQMEYNRTLDARIESVLTEMSKSERERIDLAFETWLDAQPRNPLQMFKSEHVRAQVRRVELRRFMIECVLDD